MCGFRFEPFDVNQKRVVAFDANPTAQTKSPLRCSNDFAQTFLLVDRNNMSRLDADDQGFSTLERERHGMRAAMPARSKRSIDAQVQVAVRIEGAHNLGRAPRDSFDRELGRERAVLLCLLSRRLTPKSSATRARTIRHHAELARYAHSRRGGCSSCKRGRANPDRAKMASR